MTLIIILLALNLVIFFLFGSDKLLAKLGWNRISERALYVAMILGPLGALLGMKLFRHKTSKTSFQLRAIVPFLLGCALLIGAVYLQYS